MKEKLAETETLIAVMFNEILFTAYRLLKNFRKQVHILSKYCIKRWSISCIHNQADDYDHVKYLSN
jgi:hypothetical protein